MIRSMTGFGRGQGELDGMSALVEVRSVNHRFLETNVRMPTEYGFLEHRIKRVVQERVVRGRLDIFINLSGTAKAKKVIVDKPLAMAYYKCLEGLEQELGKRCDQVVSYLASLPGVLIVEEEVPDEGRLWALVEEVLGQALDEMIGMREREGSELRRYLIERLVRLEDLLNEIKEQSPKVVEDYRTRMERKLAEITPEGMVDETRLAMEVAILAERADISEEVSRSHSHIGQFRVTLNGEGGAVGRKLEFILQEMNREVNTVGAKAGDFAIAKLAVEAKAELERMREQVQNVE